MPTVQADRLTRIGAALLKAAGASDEEASAVAVGCVNANLAGHDSHGIIAIPTYIDRIKAGHIVPGAKWTIVQESPTTTVIDGHWGFGFHVNAKAMALTIEKAKTANVAACTVFRQSHVGRLAAYPMMAMREGMIGLATADSGRSPKHVAPFGGREARLGTNPISIAVPSDLEAPFYLDMATSAVAAGKIQLAVSRGEEIPTGWIVDSEGRQTTDPKQFRKGGALLPLGGTEGYKGSGLAAMVEVLCGLLTGLGFGVEPTGRHNDGCFMAVFNVAAFRPLKDFKKEVAEFARYLKATPPSEGSTGVFYPGEVEYIREQQRRVSGIDVEDATWDKLRALAGEYKLAAELGLADLIGFFVRSKALDWFVALRSGSENNMTRQMAMVGFLQAQNCTNLPSSWRHPESRDDSMSADYYQEIGRILESGKFHMAFFDDRLAMPDRYGNDHAHTVEYGIRCVKMDPIVVLTAMGMATEKLGLASTCSTTYYEPFDVARRFATLDLMTGGRAAWNVVTSVNDGEAHNMGKDAHLDHDFRYDRADEFMEVVLGQWDSWEDGSLLIDKKSGRFADPTKVKRLDHKGQFFKSRGPFTVPRSQQGHPVIIQAGASGRGQRFAGRWGEVIFTAARNLAGAKQGYDAIRRRGREGRPRSRPDVPLQSGHAGARRDQIRGRRQDGADRKAAAGDRRAVAAVGRAELRFCLQGHRRAADHGRTAGHAGHARHPRRRAADFRQDQSEHARFHQILRPRPDPGRHRRRAEGDRRPAGRDVR